jgi:hypothetical protein
MYRHAIHESGHATVATMIGLPVERLTLDCCDLYPSKSPRRSCMVSFAGPLSEQRYAGLSDGDCAKLWEGDWHGDFENILSHDFAPGERGQLRQRSAFFVDRYWDRIERLAAALAERGALSGAEVEAVVRGDRR